MKKLKRLLILINAYFIQNHPQMIISKKNKFVYIKTPKTAGSSLELYLSQFCGLNDIITPLLPNQEKIKKKLKILPAQNYILEKFTLRYLKEFRFKHKLILSDHLSLKFVERHIDINLKKYFIFTVVRNPYDWIVSMFCWYVYSKNILDKKNMINPNKVKINIVFKLFLSLECHLFFKTMKSMIMSKKLNIKVYKFENLKNEIKNIKNIIGFSNEKIKFENIQLNSQSLESKIRKQIKFDKKDIKLVLNEGKFFFENFRYSKSIPKKYITR